MSNNKKICVQKGTHDILPDQIPIWNFVQNEFKSVCEKFGYKEIRFPVFEATELFNRGVGDTTDVVQKEMYTFEDKGGRSITLRPEGTASTVRSYLENNLYTMPAPVKLFYNITCYRYERPQAGRFREFNQFGIENFGSCNAYTDAEVISLAMQVLQNVGIKGLTLYINSIGCAECRKKYNDLLQKYLISHKNDLCELCNDRMMKNPLRVLDCKNDDCKKVIENAPLINEVLCDDCKKHFGQLKDALTSIGLEYKIDSSLVRGLDYYTRTVFEIKSDCLGAQSTVCGGGRYDGLVEQLGGSPTPGIGFSMGVERLISIITTQNVEIQSCKKPDIFIASIGDQANKFAFTAVYNFRKNGYIAEFDHNGKSIKAQMKYADKINAKYCVVIGDDEITSNTAQIKNMDTGETRAVKSTDLLGGILNV